MGNTFTFAKLKSFLSPFRDAFSSNGTTLSELEYGIVFVACQMAALDGEMTADECKLLDEFSKTCSAKDEDGKLRGRDFALRSAGYLAIIAHFSDYTEESRLAAFMEAVDKGLPNGFAATRREDLSYAFAFWTAMAMSDGCFSSIEHKALELLKVRFDTQRAIRKQAEIDNIKRVAAMSIDYDKTIEQLSGKREPSLQGEDFVFQAVEMLRKFQGEK